MVDFDALVLGPCMAAFAVPAVWHPGDGPPVPFRGILTRNAEEVAQQGDTVTIARSSWIGCRAADLHREPAESELIEVEGCTWTVAEVHPDTVGHLRITLHGPLG